MPRQLTILDAMDDAKLFAPWFARSPRSWDAWRAFLSALFGLQMTEQQAEVFRTCTGRSTIPTSPSNEAWLICGRRAGKSFTMALIAVYLACFRSYREHLAPGERAAVMVIAADRKQSRVVMRYVRALLNDIPMLK